jgi:hypothetical protein
VSLLYSLPRQSGGQTTSVGFPTSINHNPLPSPSHTSPINLEKPVSSMTTRSRNSNHPAVAAEFPPQTCKRCSRAQKQADDKAEGATRVAAEERYVDTDPEIQAYTMPACTPQ